MDDTKHAREPSSGHPPKATLTVGEAAKILGISRAIAYRSARLYVDTNGTRGLPVIQMGRRLLVPVSRLEALLAGHLGP